MIALPHWIDEPMPPEPIEFEPEGLVCVGLIAMAFVLCVVMAAIGRRR